MQHPGKLPLSGYGHLPDRQVERKDGSVAPSTRDLASDADNPRISSRQVPLDVLVVLLVIRRRHEHADVPADHLGSRVTEKAFCPWVEGFDPPLRVNDDDSVNGRIDDRAQPRVCFSKILRSAVDFGFKVLVGLSKRISAAKTHRRVPDRQNLDESDQSCSDGDLNDPQPVEVPHGGHDEYNGHNRCSRQEIEASHGSLWDKTALYRQGVRWSTRKALRSGSFVTRPQGTQGVRATPHCHGAHIARPGRDQCASSTRSRALVHRRPAAPPVPDVTTPLPSSARRRYRVAP